MPRDRDKGAREQARTARKAPSVAEDIVWEALRNSRTGFKFRREHPIGGYRLDFYCAEAQLAVEMDGEQHLAEKDVVRDAELLGLGIATYRIPNRRFFRIDKDVFVNDLAVIVRLCEDRAGRKAFPR